MLELGSRTRLQAPPPDIVWEALTDPYRRAGRQWLNLAPDEVAPSIIETLEPSVVVSSSLWPVRPNDRIRFEIEAAGSGSSLRWTLLTPDNPPEAKLLNRMRYRMNFLINAELLYSFGQ